jgi:hypothetical protein
VTRRSSDATERPHQHDVELGMLGVVHHAIEAGSLSFRAAEPQSVAHVRGHSFCQPERRRVIASSTL